MAFNPLLGDLTPDPYAGQRYSYAESPDGGGGNFVLDRNGTFASIDSGYDSAPWMTQVGLYTPSPLTGGALYQQQDYNALLQSLGLTYSDLGMGKYGMLDTAGSSVGTGYKSAADAIYDIAKSKAQPYIKQNAQGKYYFDAPNFGRTVDPSYDVGGNHMGENPQAKNGTWNSAFGYYIPESVGGDYIGGEPRAAQYTPYTFNSMDEVNEALDRSGYFTQESRGMDGGIRQGSGLETWEALGQLLNGGQYAVDQAQMRKFGTNGQNETISGANTLFGSEPVFDPTTKQLLGYKMQMGAAKPEDFGYQSPTSIAYKDDNGKTTSQSALARQFNDPATWNAISTDLGNGQRFVPLDKVSQIPGWTQTEDYNYAVEKTSGLGGLGALLGAGLGLATGMPWLGGAVAGLASTGKPGPAILGGLGGALSSNFGSLFGNSATGTAGSTAGSAAGGGMFDWLSDAGSWISDLFGGGGGSGATEFASSIASAADPIEAMYQTMAATGTTSVTDAAAALGFNSANAMLGAINPSWLSAGSSFLIDAAKQAASKLASGGGSTGLLSGGLQAIGGYLSGNAATDAAKTSAQAQLEAARIAADAAKFKPVGVTTRFGQSNFTKDAQGNVTSAGYNMPADIKAMQDSLLGAAPGMLSQFTGSQAATAPMGVGAQRAMSLGNQYLNTDPMAQAKKYYDDQQAIMATGRARDQAGALTGEFNRGTYGLATGATGMMGAANPRLEAMYNAQRQQDLQAAANATQGGMDYAKFGAGLVGTGGNMLRDMYGTQTAAYSPFATAMTGAQNIEGLGQNALDMSINIGKTASPAQAGSLLGQGMLGAAQTMQQANQYSPWGTALMNAGNALGSMQQPQQQQQYAFNPFTGVRL